MGREDTGETANIERYTQPVKGIENQEEGKNSLNSLVCITFQGKRQRFEKRFRKTKIKQVTMLTVRKSV